MAYINKLAQYKIDRLKEQRQYEIENYERLTEILGVMDYSLEEKLNIIDKQIESIKKGEFRCQL